jgi:hypothetical protein
MLLLLHEQKQLVLQHDKSDIDYIDNWSDLIGDDPPNGGWGIYGAFPNHIHDQLISILEKLE